MQLFLTAAALRNLPPFFLRMSSVFQALLGLTAAKDRAESSSEGRGGGVWLAARLLTTPQQGCERPVSEHYLIYQWNATAAAACERVCFSVSVFVKGGGGDGHGGPAGTPLKDPQLSTPHVLSQPGSKGSSTKRKREGQRARDSTEQHTPRREEREREERAESKGSEAGSLGGGLRR